MILVLETLVIIIINHDLWGPGGGGGMGSQERRKFQHFYVRPHFVPADLSPVAIPE